MPSLRGWRAELPQEEQWGVSPHRIWLLKSNCLPNLESWTMAEQPCHLAVCKLLCVSPLAWCSHIVAPHHLTSGVMTSLTAPDFTTWLQLGHGVTNFIFLKFTLQHLVLSQWTQGPRRAWLKILNCVLKGASSSLSGLGLFLRCASAASNPIYHNKASCAAEENISATSSG